MIKFQTDIESLRVGVGNYVEGGVKRFRGDLERVGGKIIKDSIEKFVPESEITSNTHYKLKDNIIELSLEGNEVGDVGFSDDVDFRAHFPDTGTKFQEGQLYMELALDDAERGVISKAEDIFRRSFR